jgi:SNF2 family DNA or RNA helicase
VKDIPDDPVVCERQGKRITVHFAYNPERVTKIRQVPGRSFARQPTNHWKVPLDLTVCRQLRALFGDDLLIGGKLRSWAQEARRDEEALGRIATVDHADLPVLRKKLPTLWRALYFGPLGKHAKTELGMTEEDLDAAEHVCSWLAGVEPWSHGSYQTADVRFLADSPAPLNANHQGLGKTLEAIAEIFESGRESGWHLIIAPSAAVDGTWEPELEKWLADAPCTVGIFACYGRRRKREATLHAALYSEATANFVVVNPAMVQYRKDPFNLGPMAIKAKEKEYTQACHCSRLKAAHWHYEPGYPDLMDVYWDTIVNDEVHKGNIRNHRTITGHSMTLLKMNEGGKPVAMSGTPMKKKGADIWGVLHWLRPDVFTSYWNFAKQFFDVKAGYGGHLKVGALREEMEAAFYQALIPYVVRRTKKEALPWLPDKMLVPIVVNLSDDQLRQYKAMEEEGIARLESGDEEMTSILAEFTRMQQFANCYHVRRAGARYLPDPWRSVKLDALFEKLDEAGITDWEDPSDDQVVIFSRFKEMLDCVAQRLKKKKVEYNYIHGGVNDRRTLIEDFQTGQVKIMLVVTSAGGVSLTLDAADVGHFIEPSWAPDEKEQAEDRLHRASRIHQVTIYTYIARGTIDEYIEETAFEKDSEHKRILDVRRRLGSE